MKVNFIGKVKWSQETEIQLKDGGKAKAFKYLVQYSDVMEKTHSIYVKSYTTDLGEKLYIKEQIVAIAGELVENRYKDKEGNWQSKGHIVDADEIKLLQ